jgi:predicted RNA methylase
MNTVNESPVRIDSEITLVALARDLGAANFGGPVTKAEEKFLKAADRVVKCSDKTVRTLQSAIRNGDDPLGIALCSLRTPLERRHTGTFYTPEPIVNKMVDWTVDWTPTRFIDAGCGSGRFVRNILARLSNANIIAVDIDPIATIMTRAVVASFRSKNAITLNIDYTKLLLANHHGRTAYIGNPPYVRHHDLQATTKTWATQTAKKLGHRVSGLAGLHTLFLLATAELARKGDVGAFVTSAEWMDTNYGSIVRDLMLNGLGGKGVHAFAPESTPFSDAMTTAAITYFEVGSKPKSLTFSLSDSPTAPQELQTRREIPASVLANNNRWSPILRSSSVEHCTCKHPTRINGRVATGARPPDAPSAPGTLQSSLESKNVLGVCPTCHLSFERVTLRSIARVHRGQATGANDFFVLSRENARVNGIERYCRPVVSRAKQIFTSGGILRDGPHLSVLLEVPAEIRLKEHPALATYLRQGESSRKGELPVCERWIPSHRRSWFSVGAPCPPIIATYMARQAPFFALNPDGIALINIGHGIHPMVDMSDDDIALLVEALNSERQQFVGKGRTYHGGLEKFEPREMENLPLPFEFERLIRKRLSKATLSATRRRDSAS